MGRAPSKLPGRHAAGSGQRVRRSSIVEVAARAQVSTATVSRVLNNHGTVHPDLVRRVREAVQQTGYLPNVSARALSSGRSRLLGVIISNLTNPFFPELLQRFEERAVLLGYEVLVASTAYDLQRMSTCIDRMLERKVDGVAVMTFGVEGPLLTRFVDHGVPLVFMDRAPEGLNNYAIQVNYEAGIFEAVEHLFALGHRRIGYISGPQHQASVANRSRAVHNAFRSLQLEQAPELIFTGDHTLQSGEAGLAHFAAVAQPPTAILCSNDLSAIGVMHAASKAGIRIPNDLSLIGFDGIEIGAYMVPALTSVLMSRKAIADLAVDLLCSRMEGNPAELTPLPTQLILRQTTGSPAGTLVQRSRHSKTEDSKSP